MSRVKLLAVMLLLAAPAGAAAAPDDIGKMPAELVREMRFAQDEALLASRGARATIRQKIVDLSGQLAKFDAAVWEDPKNARAALIYVLSGGDPRVLNRLIDAEKLGVDKPLVKAVLAYGEQRDEDAVTLFQDIDMSTLDPGLVGHVAMVRGLLLSKRAPDRSIAFFDLARISSAGTIVEEAALRQEAVVAATAGQFAKSEALASQYFRRFPNSLYVQSFSRQLAQQLVAEGYAGDEARLKRLSALLAGLPADVRRNLCLLIAEEGIGAAKVEMVEFAARVAADDAKGRPQDAARLGLFKAAALVVTDKADEALAALGSVDRSLLAPREEALLDAALAVARAVRRPPQPVDEAPRAEDGDTSPPKMSKLIGDADAAMARADQLLSEAVR